MHFRQSRPRGDFGATIVEAHDDVPLLGQHLVPEVGRTTPTIDNGLAGRFAVNVHEQRVLLLRIESLGLDAIAVQLDPVFNLDLKKIDGLQLELFELLAECCVIYEIADRFMFRQLHEIDRRGL